MRLKDQSYLVFDIETATDIPQRKQRVIQIGWVVINNSKIVKKECFAIHHKNTENLRIRPKIQVSIPELAQGRAFSDVLNDLIRDIGEVQIIVGHNINHDIRQLLSEAELLDIPNIHDINELFNEKRKLDTLRLSRAIFRDSGSHKLSSMLGILGIRETIPRHHALNDSIYTAHIMGHMLKKLRKEEDIETFEELEIRIQTKTNGKESYHQRRLI